MLGKIRQLIQRHNMLAAGDKILVACSGGPDSLALLHIFNGLRLEYNINLFAIHVDHMFRGQESVQEADFVEAFCQQHGIICYRTAIDVPKLIAETGLSAQEAGRVARYQYFRMIAKTLGGAKIATGHHRDDQAETVLMRLLRGAGSEGIRGIKPVNNDLIRPLLAVTRAEINQYCSEYKLEPRFDRSNLKLSYLRNRVRIQLLPELETQYNSAIKETLCRTAAIIGDEHDFIEETAKRMWFEVVQEEEGKIFIGAQPMAKLHVAIKRELLRLAIEKQQGHLQGISFEHLESLLVLLHRGRVGSTIQLPGELVADKSYQGIYLRRATKEALHSMNLHQELTIPGITVIEKLGIQITAELLDNKEETNQPNTAFFDWQMLSAPIMVRTRQVGDRFRPLGFHGNKKIKDFFIDAKIPKVQRDCIPIFCDRNNIIWIGGYRQAENAKVTKNTKKFLKITMNC